jgi:hypothetical protein
LGLRGLKSWSRFGQYQQVEGIRTGGEGNEIEQLKGECLIGLGNTGDPASATPFSYAISAVLGHDLRMPEAKPGFSHDLWSDGGGLRDSFSGGRSRGWAALSVSGVRSH